jgi:pyruvate, water dikinase
MHLFNPSEVLVADMTDLDWEPIMKRAAAIITNRGGRTCHAAIIARELGIPAVVGTGTATSELRDGQPVTVSCAEGDTGYVYAGLLDFAVKESEQDSMPEIGVKIMMNVGTPDQAFAFSRLPNAGVGLARLEFIINNQIGIHPKALLNSPSSMSHCAARSVTPLRRTRRRVISSYVVWLRELRLSRRRSRRIR